MHYKPCYKCSQFEIAGYMVLSNVTKFNYFLHWNITGAPRHIVGQALFFVNIGNW